MDPDTAMREEASAQQKTEQQTSIRYLRLHNGFTNMLKSGLERIDGQAFISTFKGQVADHQLQPLWQLLQKQRGAILRVATEEMEAACNEVGLQQQLLELEALILQRGLMSTDSSTEAITLLPKASEDAARMAAKQAEKRHLQQQLEELLQQQQAVETELQQKQQQANDLLQEFDKTVGDQVDKVYQAAKRWMEPAHAGDQHLAEAMQQ